MNKKATMLACLILASCAGRSPNPVTIANPGDHEMSCAGIAQEMQANTRTIAALGGEKGSKVAQNVAAGVVGLFIWPVWFAMDFQGAAEEEQQALSQRNAHLAGLARDRRC